MNPLSRREMMKGSAAAVALAFAQTPWSLFGAEDAGSEETVIPFLDAQVMNPKRPMLEWAQLHDWITPNEQLFAVSHYGTPKVDAANWQLEIGGLVKQPRTFSLNEIKARQRRSVVATLECSGNSSNPGFLGAIGNPRWTGTPLAPLLRECGLAARGIEVVFFGADEKSEKIREQEFLQNFARSLSRRDAMGEDVILAYEMNGEPLSVAHGGPLRLIVPGWFGIAWVKWLNRIEILDRRYMSKFMAREYVTLRGEEREGRTIWRETSVGPIDVKSIVARVVRRRNGGLRISGAAWTDGTPLKTVELKVDSGTWIRARLDRRKQARYAWTFWSVDLPGLPRGEHVLVSRAVDAEGRIQPEMEDDEIRLKKTYWEANQQYPRRIQI